MDQKSCAVAIKKIPPSSVCTVGSKHHSRQRSGQMIWERVKEKKKVRVELQNCIFPLWGESKVPFWLCTGGVPTGWQTGGTHLSVSLLWFLRKCKQSVKVCVCVVLTAVLSLFPVSTGPTGSTPVHPPAGHRTQFPQQQRDQTELYAGTSVTLSHNHMYGFTSMWIQAHIINNIYIYIYIYIYI